MNGGLVILPVVWATAEMPLLFANEQVVRRMPHYRRYTEAILRRYLRMSLEAGRAPSLLGREMFRGQVTSYRVHSFEDVVIFVHDVENCLVKLDTRQQQIIEKVALQEYSQEQAAEMMGLAVTTVVRRYGRALDRLTNLFLEAQLLDPMKCCQGIQEDQIDVSSCLEWR